MKKANNLILALAVVLVAAWSLLALAQLAAPAHAAAESSAVTAKLDAILAGQQQVMAAIESVKQDIAVIKIRVTQSQ